MSFQASHQCGQLELKAVKKRHLPQAGVFLIVAPKSVNSKAILACYSVAGQAPRGLESVKAKECRCGCWKLGLCAGGGGTGDGIWVGHLSVISKLAKGESPILCACPLLYGMPRLVTQVTRGELKMGLGIQKP